VTKGSGSNFLYGFDEKKILFLSVYGERINQPSHLCCAKWKSKLALSEIGTNDATFSPNYKYYINTFSSSEATTYSLNEAKTGTQIKVIEKIMLHW
jgi:dipeptidyl-peptidase-4